MKLNIKLTKNFYKTIEVYTKGTDLKNVQEADFIGAKIIYNDGHVGYINDFSTYRTKVSEFVSQESKTEDELKNSKDIVIKQMNKNYTSFAVYTKGTDLTKIDPADFVGAEVVYSDSTGEHTEYIRDYSVLKNILDEYAIQKGKTTDELITDKTIVVQNANDISTYDDTNKKGGFLKKFLKITSIGAAVALIGYAGYRIYKRVVNKEDKKPDKRVETQVPYNDVTPYISNTPYRTVVPSPTPTAGPTNTPKVVTPAPDRLTSIVMRMCNGERVSEDDLYYFMNEVGRIAYTNIPGIRDLLSGKSMSGDKDAKIELYKMFPKDSKEYIVLKAFCLPREDLGHNAFAQRPETVRSNLKDYMDIINSYIFDGTGIDYGSDVAYFYELSPLGRFIVYMLGSQTLLGDSTYNGKINGKVCNYIQLVDEYSSIYSGTVELLLNIYGTSK